MATRSTPRRRLPTGPLPRRHRPRARNGRNAQHTLGTDREGRKAHPPLVRQGYLDSGRAGAVAGPLQPVRPCLAADLLDQFLADRAGGLAVEPPDPPPVREIRRHGHPHRHHPARRGKVFALPVREGKLRDPRPDAGTRQALGPHGARTRTHPASDRHHARRRKADDVPLQVRRRPRGLCRGRLPHGVRGRPRRTGPQAARPQVHPPGIHQDRHPGLHPRHLCRAQPPRAHRVRGLDPHRIRRQGAAGRVRRPPEDLA